MISELNKDKDILRNENKNYAVAIEELKNDKLKIFEEKSDIINSLRNDIENLNKNVNEGNRKSIINDSIIKNHESEMQGLLEKINSFENEKSQLE